MAATPRFRSAEEFVELMDRVFAMVSEDPEIGPRLRDADVPQRMDFPDLALVLNVRAARVDEQGCLVWTWSEDIDWTPRVCLTMASEVANRFFQGRENVTIAIARRRIRADGDLRATLELIPMIKPVYPRYRALLQAEFPHLLV
ncbi:MAG: hypothetical protein M3370_09645 [Actinomycetota bacterium]|nr:hypothetical protein [Actinomycetota bacterium]